MMLENGWNHNRKIQKESRMNILGGYTIGKKKAKDEVLREEIIRLKEQSVELREALDHRIQQSKKLQELLDEKEDEINGINQRVSMGFAKILEWINDFEENISEQIDDFQQDNDDQIKELKEFTEQSVNEIQLSLDRIKCDLQDLQKMGDDSKQLLAEINVTLKDKADKKSISKLIHKNTTLTVLTGINTIGVIIILIVTLL